MIGYNFIIQNKEFLKVFYGLIVVIISVIIVLKTNRLFKLSLHQGIRYFRNAFFFYALAFITRYFFGTNFLKFYLIAPYPLIIKIFFEFFIIMAGFFLLYSLLWKKLKISGDEYTSSLFNPLVAIFYLFSFLIVFLDVLWWTYYFMFASQVILFAFASAISYNNYTSRKGKFLKFYFIAMLLSLVAWIFNAMAALFFQWDPLLSINVSTINILIFLIFLFGVINVTRYRG